MNPSNQSNIQINQINPSNQSNRPSKSINHLINQSNLSISRINQSNKPIKPMTHLSKAIAQSTTNEPIKSNQTRSNQTNQMIPSPSMSFPWMLLPKVGLFVTARVGTGLVVARRRDGGWSAPSALGSLGLGWGFQIGGEVTMYHSVLLSLCIMVLCIPWYVLFVVVVTTVICSNVACYYSIY